VPSSSRTGGRACTHPGVDEEGPREPVRRRWKMTMDKINTFMMNTFTLWCLKDLPCWMPQGAVIWGKGASCH